MTFQGSLCPRLLRDFRLTLKGLVHRKGIVFHGLERSMISPRRAIPEASPAERDSIIPRSQSPLRAISVSPRTRRRAESFGLVGGLLVTSTVGLHELLPLLSSHSQPTKCSVNIPQEESKAFMRKPSWE